MLTISLSICAEKKMKRASRPLLAGSGLLDVLSRGPYEESVPAILHVEVDDVGGTSMTVIWLPKSLQSCY
jgi:hypothetical protein